MTTNSDNPGPVPHTVRKLPYAILIESFGVSILIESNSKDAISACRAAVAEALPTYHRFRKGRTAQHQFAVIEDENQEFAIQKNGQPFFAPTTLETVIGVLTSQLRIIVAEFAKDFVFIHAGVVAVEGRAMVFPGNSMAGKTSLVVELIKHGASYYSDEFAIIDAEGFVWPFPKTLSIRGEKSTFEQVEHRAEDLGGKTGKKPIPISMILITEFKEYAEWSPIKRTPAEGVLDTLAYTISTRTNPEFALGVLKKVAETATFMSSPRANADEIAQWILNPGKTFKN